MTTLLRLAAAIGVLLWAVLPLHAQVDPEMKAERRKALDHPRRVIWNHDGGGSIGLTKENLPAFLNSGRSPSRLIGTQVDTIMFCSSTDFGDSVHFTKVGHFVDSNYLDSKPARTDVAKLADYLDPLTEIVRFGHAHKMEVFWSMRMNDTHDSSSHEFAAGMFAANAFKQQHLDWLLGTKENPPFHGKWSGVDYERPEVRDFVFRLAQEICENYDVDGLEFDFFRHPTFFKYADARAATTQAQCDLMTEMLRRIRIMADAEGKKRGRPILISVKTPDSAGYAKAIGLDLERWLADGLVDMLAPGGYLRMEEWSSSVNLGHRYGVKVYPSMDDVRFDSPKAGQTLDSSQAWRMAESGYRGRALQAWAAHADGIYLFDFFGGSIMKAPYPVLKDLGDPVVLLTKDRTYFGSYMGLGKVSGGGFPHQPFQKIETLSPADPKHILANQKAAAEVMIPEDFSGPEKPAITLKLRLTRPAAPQHVKVTLNGKPLTDGKTDGEWIDYVYASDLFIKGDNHCEVASEGKIEWKDLAVEVHPGHSQ